MARPAILFVSFLISALVLAQTSEGKHQFCFVGANDLRDPSAPQFDQYPADAWMSDSEIKLDLDSNPIARRYRTVIRSQLSKGQILQGTTALWFGAAVVPVLSMLL